MPAGQGLSGGDHRPSGSAAQLIQADVTATIRDAGQLFFGGTTWQGRRCQVSAPGPVRQ
ncbi:protein of unknown function [Bradyrhizobium sp. ORS 285]|nr:protein of unknown function [Bradyrhizobium sp. ORS 285]